MILGTTVYSRLRFGIGNNFSPGAQIDFVLKPFTEEEQKCLPEKIEIAVVMIKSFCLAGINITMNQFNNKV
jgi:PTH1 family peptidyl-tRNA hydrolase